MPFGTELDSDGTACFRLWAPSAASVQLDLTHERGRLELPMRSTDDGWYSASVEGIGAGTRYLFRIDDRISVSDPASRFNPQDIHAASAVIDPLAFDWPDENWCGRPWHEAVIYELHVGTFTPTGSFDAAIERLDYLAGFGVTAIELMPVADFPGRRGWGYDGVLQFAPEAAYGTPEDLKRLVAAAHARNLMIFLDVVYNHFGPEGNYLHVYAPQFFNPRHQTPWGAAINFDGKQARTVRDFFIHNALYWLNEFHFDGLRLDAVHAIADDARPDILSELCAAVRDGPGRERHVHLILENDRNEARYLRRDPGRAAPLLATAQWNDDFHHALHVLITGEQAGYYIDYRDRPLWFLGRALAEGFGYQGEVSLHREGRPRGEYSAGLPAAAFIDFMQNHDQIGNRAFGERITRLVPAPAVRLGVICMLLAPSIPMLFMGEEFAANAPFLYFCDFGPELTDKVREGRRREFGAFGARREVPDPGDEATFLRSKLDWNEIGETGHREWLALYRELLGLRRQLVVPHLAGAGRSGRFEIVDKTGLVVDWILADGTQLALRANFSGVAWTPNPWPAGSVIYASSAEAGNGWLPPHGAVWTLGAES